MNHTAIIGNVVRDPESKQINTANGPVTLCKFTVAVNQRRKGNNEQNEATFYNITAWRKLGEICQQYIKKGNKVCVSSDSGVTAHAYQGNDGQPHATLEVTADDVEFLSMKSDSSAPAPAPAAPAYTPVTGEQLPF